ncbi:hypothetical protein ACQPXH_00495 [Nocardia sp. CA-135953]|uniref:hypothetical protein n=1 Tax=Nocardia sp. CA-135953 TaxID=3239978 RepID=UPI003D963738
MTKNRTANPNLIRQIHRPNVDRIAGIVTTINAMLAGDQETAIDIIGAHGTDARIVLRWGRIVMTFTSAEQVQMMLGLFGLARQCMMDVLPRIPLPAVEESPFDVAALATITWTRTPQGAATIERMYHLALRRSISYVSLTVPPITFQILDQASLNSAIKALVHAHRLAVTVYPDGERYKRNPITDSWKRAHHGSLQRRGTGWPEY